MPLAYLIGEGISKGTISDVGKFFVKVFETPTYVFNRYYSWFKQLSSYHGSFSVSLWLPILPFLTLPGGVVVGLMSNPYRFQSNIHGSARLAELKDIKKSVPSKDVEAQMNRLCTEYIEKNGIETVHVLEEAFKKEFLNVAYSFCPNITKLSLALGLSRNTLKKQLKEYGWHTEEE